MDCLLSPDALLVAGHKGSSDGEGVTRCMLGVTDGEMLPTKALNQTPTTLCESGDGNTFTIFTSTGDCNLKKECDQPPSTPKPSRKPMSPFLREPGLDEARGGSPKMSMHDRVRKRQQLLSSTMHLDSIRFDEETEALCGTDEVIGAAMSPRLKAQCAESMRTPSRLSQLNSEGHDAFMPMSVSHNKDIYVNVSDDVVKNPILANSVRSIRMREPMDHEDVARSMKVLGASRCWTDMLDESTRGGVSVEAEDYDDILATQTPVRSLTSQVTPTKHSYVSGSVKRMSIGSIGTLGHSLSPIGTPQRSVDSILTSTTSHNKYTQTMFATGDATDLDAFGGARIEDMRKDDVNPMAYSTLPKCLISESRMGKYLALLYKHFKNMCTFIRRSSMRSDRPYFKVVQLMVQRMTRKDFTLEQVRQMAWLAPNLVTLKWVSISEAVRMRYKTEYNEYRGDHTSDVQIRIHKLDGRVCSSNSDFENTCFSFKRIICAWVARCEAQYVQDRGSTCGFDSDMALPIPLAALPTKHGNSLDIDDTVSIPTSTPTQTVANLYKGVVPEINQPTVLFSSTARSDQDAHQLSTRKASTSRSAMPNKAVAQVHENMTPARNVSSLKRGREDTMLPMATDLLDTPGMWRIRDNAKRLAVNRNTNYIKEHDVSYWKDLRRFVNALVDLSISDNRPPLLRLEWLAEFMSKHGSYRVTYDNVADWANTLVSIAPDIVNIGVSKFDDYSTVLTLCPQPRFDNAINFVDQQISTYNK
ncbi:DNA replication factor CDT1 like family member protein, putative [Babesia ovis]|uniref:DNA replication factor CDT1 like family member protein, putative n=1 Tax=Babesia ovis TaxID=5869 RepID=A0A9W5WTR3_BABOV|nr:DNA replication factor CDT1 like family member protein, putative [Babesia ovis]